MSTKYYIAYGSNLSVEQMKYRCPFAKVEGVAELQDMKMVFRLHATIEKSPGEKVPILVWTITPLDEKYLDRYEGYPKYYRKEEIEIEMTDFRRQNPKKVKAMVYIMNKGYEIETPTDIYYAIIKTCYRRFGFSTDGLTRAYKEAERKEAERKTVYE